MDETIVVGIKDLYGRLSVVKNKITGRESLEGMFGNIEMGEIRNRDVYESISFKGRFNVSIKLHRNYGRNSDGLNDLINGSIDILLESEDFSIAREHPDSLLPLPIVKTAQPLLITPYDCSFERSFNESYTTDLLESVTGFLPDVWIVTLTTLITIATLINIHMKMNHTSKPWMNPNGGFWTIISFFLKNPSMIKINWVSSILRILVTIFAFFVGKCYFENIIKSDQIAIYQPVVYTSFATIAEDQRVEVIIAPYLLLNFQKKIPPHSKYKKILDNNYKNNGMDKKAGIEMFDWFFSIPRDNKAVIYLDEPGYAILFCRFKELGFEQWNSDGLCIYEHVLQVGDPEKDDLEVLTEDRANLISLNFARKKIFKSFLTYFTRSYEMGVNEVGIKRREKNQITPSIADCVPQKPPVTHNRIDISLPFDLYNYKFSFALIVLLYIIALVILMFEIWHRRHHSSGNISHKVIEISVQWKKSNENHSSSTVQTIESRNDFVRNSIQSVANKKSKLTDVETTNSSKTSK